MTVTVDASAFMDRVDAFYEATTDAAVEAMFAEMRANGPNDTGQMVGTLIAHAAVGPPLIERLLIAPQPYSSFQDQGTGVYIGEGPIVPVSAKVLVFFWKKTGRVEFRKSVLGTPPTRWWSGVIERWTEFLHNQLGH